MSYETEAPSARVGDGAVEIQFRDLAEEQGTALSGMWLFLASELLFFGGLFLVWLVYRVEYPAGFAQAARETEFALGTINTAVLLTSSFVFACAVAWARRGDNRRVLIASLMTAGLGAAFLGLKLFEWHKDIVAGDLPGALYRDPGEANGAQLFWLFYWTGTALHMVHLVIGIGLVGWIAWRAQRGAFGPERASAAEIVGLYWSFVDMIWLVLYPLIYLAARGA